ncbi:MAG TPA: PilC/PilY family type IV pilus protein [Caldimonas sp.]|nr:PilC/PilY family type IV pilus protein [Caldimonas sp.]
MRSLAHPAPLRALGLGLLFCAIVAPARAEDIDIYADPNAANDVPNVLFVLDNSANWSSSIPAADCFYKDGNVVTTTGPKASNPGQEQGKKMAIEKCALYNLINALPVATSGGADNDALFRIGIMLLNESPNNGAYPRKAFTPLTTNNKVALKAIISGLAIGDDKGSNADFAKAMYEAYLYFKGLAPYQGQLAPKRDTAAFSGGRYNSPAGASCSRNYVIFIANGSPEGSENNNALALLTAAGGNVSPLAYPTSIVKNTDQANWMDEYARFLRSADVSSNDGSQGIITHTVAVTGASSDGLYPNFMQAVANQGGGTFHSASDADTLLKSLLEVFNEIQAVNSVFASASLPVSVNARGTYLNQVYMGMFRPDGDAKPRWRGNLKQFQFGLDATGKLSLVDSTGVSAVSASTGFISPNSVSFWTAPSTFWSNQLLGTPLSNSDSPDGEVVEKGAAAQRLRYTYATSQDSRNVLTCIGCAAGTLLGGTGASRFATANTSITDTALGVSGSTARNNLINWVRGGDNAGDEAGPTTTPATTVRPSIHGDVLHSRPAVVNYGGSIGVVVFYGANDGMLHAINGNSTGTGAGEELWSFVPEEMFGKLNRLRTNSPEVRLPSTPAASLATPRDYFIDGPIGVYQRFASDGSVAQALIFVGMRRGGRLLYAFDVTTPSAPVLLWKKTPTQLPELGQSWSEPKVARIKGNSNAVLVLGAGYDAAAEDAGTPGSTTMGNAIYVLDAVNGNLLRSFPTSRSVPADLSVIDSDFDGYIDRAYGVDLAGTVYRIDFEVGGDNAPAAWTKYTIADLSGGTSTGRKFFFGPDVIVTRAFTALMVGSGDREKPLLANTRDHFFELFDRNLTKGPPASYTSTAFSDLVPAGATSNTEGRGCYVELEQGEKVVNAATSIGGVSFFGTNRPSSGAVAAHSCSANLGVAKTYSMPLFCVTPSSSTLAGGGLPPTPVSGIVTVGSGASAKKVVFVIGAPNPKNSGIEGSRVNPVIKVPRSRIYWYQEVNR